MSSGATAGARILCLRIGGNDLLSALRLRRPPGVTLYVTPLGTLIDCLVGLCKPAGYTSSPPPSSNMVKYPKNCNGVAPPCRTICTVCGGAPGYVFLAI